MWGGETKIKNNFKVQFICKMSTKTFQEYYENLAKRNPSLAEVQTAIAHGLASQDGGGELPGNGSFKLVGGADAGNVYDYTIKLMKDAILKYAANRDSLNPAERAFMKMAIHYLTAYYSSNTQASPATISFLVDAFNYLHSKSRYNYGDPKRPGVGLYIKRFLGNTPLDMSDRASAYTACLTDAAARLEVALAVIPKAQWSNFMKLNEYQQCKYLSEELEKNPITDNMKIPPPDYIPDAENSIPEIMCAGMLIKLGEDPQTFGFQDEIASKLDNPDQLKLLNKLVFHSDDQTLKKHCIEAFAEPDIDVKKRDLFAERSTTNDVPSTFDLIRQVQEKGDFSSISVDMTKMNAKQIGKLREQLLCHLGQIDPCPYDCGKCKSCTHTRECKSCMRGTHADLAKCGIDRVGKFQQIIKRDFVANRIRSSTEEMLASSMRPTANLFLEKYGISAE